MLMNKLLYCIKTAFRNISAHIMMNAVATSTIAVTFVVFISFILLLANISFVKTTITDRVQIIAYVRNTAPAEAVAKTHHLIESIPQVQSVQYISREEALRQLRDMLQGQDGILEGLRDNPLSASFEISLKPEMRDDTGIAAVVNALKKIETIDDVEYGRAWLERFATLFESLKIAGLVLAGLLFLFSLLIVSNTIKLLIYHRRDEIEILKLIGATNAFIKLPFCIEGMIQGSVGAAIALGVVYGAALVCKKPLGDLSFVYLGASRFIFLDPLSCIGLVMLGAGLGLAGSLFAVSALEEIHT